MSTGNGSRLRGTGGEIRRVKERGPRSAKTDVCYVNQPGLTFLEISRDVGSRDPVFGF